MRALYSSTARLVLLRSLKIGSLRLSSLNACGQHGLLREVLRGEKNVLVFIFRSTFNTTFAINLLTSLRH